MIEKGSLIPEEYISLDQWHDRIWQDYAEDEMVLNEMKRALTKVYTNTNTCFGLIYTAPHGYKGDFEIIDRIYQQKMATDKSFTRWDAYCQQLNAVKPVRNRKQYFCDLLNQLNQNKPKARILNLTSGSGRDVKEFFEENPDIGIQLDCVELDKNAIQYTRKLIGKRENIRFINHNILILNSDQQ
ncbi:MAG: hypothetical protein AAGJ18_15065 [Bacteroidota bacterium]